jgi:hypothetical protein
MKKNIDHIGVIKKIKKKIQKFEKLKNGLPKVIAV